MGKLWENSEIVGKLGVDWLQTKQVYFKM